MASQNKIVKAPFKGMDMRPHQVAEAGTCPVAINVDWSDQTIRPRAPQRVVATNFPAKARLHYVDRPGINIPRRLIAVGPDANLRGESIVIKVIDLDDYSIDVSVNITGVYGERPYNPGWNCTFTDVFLGKTVGFRPRPVTLVHCPSGTYVVDLLTMTITRGSVSRDAFQIATTTQNYWVDVPKATIGCRHLDAVWYAGFQDQTEAWLDSAVEGTLSPTAQAVITPERTALTLTPACIVYSDPSDPFGIIAQHIFTVPAHEKVTGLHSTSQGLLIFTDRAIYGLSGGTDADFVLSQLANCGVDAGCVSPSSIVDVGGVIYYLSRSGVYATGGFSQPQAIPASKGLEPLFRGRHSQTSNHTLLRYHLAAQLAYPWRVDAPDLASSCGRYMQSRRQIWWSLPVDTSIWNAGCFGVTAVLNLDSGAWSLYCQNTSSRTNGTSVSCMGPDAIEADGRWFTGNALGELSQYDVGTCDGPNSSTGRGIPMIYLSQWWPGSDADEYVTVNEVWIRNHLQGFYETQTGTYVPGTSDTVFIDLPAIGLEGEDATFDWLTVEGTYTTENRQTSEKQIRLHPSEDVPTALGFINLGTDKISGGGTYSQQCGRDSVGLSAHAKMFRICLVDNAKLWWNRGPKLEVVSVSAEYSSSGSQRQ